VQRTRQTLNNEMEGCSELGANLVQMTLFCSRHLPVNLHDDVHSHWVSRSKAGRELVSIVSYGRHALIRYTSQSLLQGGASIIPQTIRHAPVGQNRA
jgi:hypothetical protein